MTVIQFPNARERPRQLWVLKILETIIYPVQGVDENPAVADVEVPAVVEEVEVGAHRRPTLIFLPYPFSRLHMLMPGWLSW